MESGLFWWILRVFVRVYLSLSAASAKISKTKDLAGSASQCKKHEKASPPPKERALLDYQCPMGSS